MYVVYFRMMKMVKIPLVTTTWLKMRLKGTLKILYPYSDGLELLKVRLTTSKSMNTGETIRVHQ
jgi:hypothetical protein